MGDLLKNGNTVPVTKEEQSEKIGIRKKMRSKQS